MTILEALRAAQASPGKVGARPVGERRWVMIWVYGGWNRFGKRIFYGRGRSRRLGCVNMGVVIQPNEVMNERGPVEWETVSLESEA